MKKPWYERTWLVIILCLTIFPVGFYALWKNSSIAKGWKITWTSLIGLLFIVGLTAEDDKEDKKANASIEQPAAIKEQPVAWQIADIDSSRRQITFRIVLSDRTDDKAQLIEIARQLKNERDWTEKLVCFFEIKTHSTSGAWASCAYMPNCESCGTDKDSDGTTIEYKLIGMTAEMANRLQGLTLASIADKEEVVSYLEDIPKCKTILYRVDKKPNKLFRTHLFADGSIITDWQEMKKVNGQTRYYFPDEIDAGIYYVINEDAKKVDYYNDKGDCWQSFAME